MTRLTQAQQEAQFTLRDAYKACPESHRDEWLDEILAENSTPDRIEQLGNRLGRLSHEMARRPMHQWGSAEIAEHGRVR